MCLRVAELGVPGECLLPVVAGLLSLVGPLMAFGQVTMYAGKVVGVARLCCQLERRRQLGAGGDGLAGFVQGLGQGAQRDGLTMLVARLLVQRGRLPQVADGPLVFALPQADLAQAPEASGYADGTVELAVDGEGLFVESGGLGELVTVEAELASPFQCFGFAVAVVAVGVTGPTGFADGTAASFSGSGSQVSIPSGYFAGTGPESMELWFQTTAKNETLFSASGSTGGEAPLIWIDGTNCIEADVAGARMQSSCGVNDGKWHQLVLRERLSRAHREPCPA